jgi:dTDP-D-glucose 4,6-dehydratase
MEKEFVPYGLAVKLKALGFDEPCLKNWDYGLLIVCDYATHLKAPLYQQAFRWFREKYNLSSWIYNSDMTKFFYTILQNGRIVKSHNSSTTYEKAEFNCLVNLIEIVEYKIKSKMENKKQSSVECLFEKLWETPKDKLTWHSIFEQAKEMEKQNIINAYKQGQHDSEPIRPTDAEQYYNETFKSE